MKTMTPFILSVGCAATLLVVSACPADAVGAAQDFGSVAQELPPPPPPPPPPEEELADEVAEMIAEGELPRPDEAAATNNAPQDAAGPASSSAQPANRSEDASPAPAASRESAAPATEVPAEPVKPVADGERGLRLNFRGVPLEMVLNYLSEAAGFVIFLDTEVRGKVDVWANQPLTKEEAVDLLNKALARNGYAAIRSGRTLSIVSRDEAKKKDIPVLSGNNPEDIPKSDQIVTQIVPIKFINAVQLIKDLQPLLPTSSTMTANEAGNALVITDTQINIRRMTEIVKALDTAVASVSRVKVFTLRYADAKSLASIIKDVFQTSDSSRGATSGDPRRRFFEMFRGGGGEGAADTSRPNSARVNAVADERSNSVVVGAPDDLMPTIEELVRSVDTNVEDITEVRVFRLKYADPVETADLLAELFPDETRTSSSTSGRGQIRFGGFGGPFGGFGNRGGNNATEQSSRMQQQSRVIAVPDQRTGSVVVSAAHELMVQIEKMIAQLDEDPAKKKKVFTYKVENTDPQQVQQVLQELFGSTTTSTRSSARNTAQPGNQLNTRATQMQNQNTTRRATTGFGGSTGTGGQIGNR